MSAEGAGDTKKAVMFHIHGAAFERYAGDDYLCGPDFMIERDVIVVTMNYRLGIFGFLSMNTPEISGNMGMKDQQMALKWIHANIERFGGGPDRITVTGHSSGAIHANFHVINKESAKYFSRHIAMSGVSIMPMALKRGRYFDELYKVAENLSNPVNNCGDLIRFLKEAPADTLIEHTKNFKWRPTIEGTR